MKRIFLLLLCLAMLLSGTVASAENAEKEYLGVVSTNGNFELRCTLPDGYSVSARNTGTDSGNFLAVIMSESPAKPVMILSVAFDEMYADVKRLNDLDADALAQIEQTFRAEDEVDISYYETTYGTKLMVTREIMDSVDFYTIYKGYQIEFVLVNGTEAAEELTEEQIQLAIGFLSDLDFVDTGLHGDATDASGQETP